MIQLESREDRLQYDLLATPMGISGSGCVRYAAAMYFYQRAMIGDRALEVYRICCKQDDENPLAALDRIGCIHEVGLRLEPCGEARNTHLSLHS
jgi:hypothetical protein